MEKEDQKRTIAKLIKELRYSEEDLENIRAYYTCPDRMDKNFQHPNCSADYYPWEDVTASMLYNTDSITYIDKTCRVCGDQLIKIKFKSPSWTWRQLCGRAGEMILCVECPCQIKFRLTIMN